MFPHQNLVGISCLSSYVLRALPLSIATPKGWRGARLSAAPIRHIGAQCCLVASDVTGGRFVTQRSPNSRPGQLIVSVVLLRQSGSSVGKVVELPTRLQF
jgi:hypothetical protein